METTYLGTFLKDEWVAMFSVRFGTNNGVRQSCVAVFLVSLPMMGLNQAEKHELTKEEQVLAIEMITNELKQNLK